MGKQLFKAFSQLVIRTLEQRLKKDLLFLDMIKVSKEDDFTGKPKLLLYDQIIIDDICVFKTL